MDLLEQYQTIKQPLISHLKQLRDVFNEHLIDTADNVLTNDDVRDWLTGDEGEETRFLSDDEVVDSVSTIEEDCENGSGRAEVSPAVRSFATSTNVAKGRRKWRLCS